jgi:polyisoprenoid-binding protein YceI
MAAEKWVFDTAHSSVGFSVRHLMISKVHGNFTQWTGHIEFDEANPSASSVEAQIDVASIDTKEAQRDGHLKSPDFFDVEKYPHLTFKSTSVTGSGEHLDVKGDLTLHGVTHPVTLKVEYAGRAKHPMNGSERAGFSAHTTINRKDFGLGWNAVLEAGGVAVSEKVEITLEIQAIKA